MVTNHCLLFLGSSQVRSSATKLPSTFRTTNLGEFKTGTRIEPWIFSPLGIQKYEHPGEKKKGGWKEGGRVSFSEKLKNLELNLSTAEALDPD